MSWVADVDLVGGQLLWKDAGDWPVAFDAEKVNESSDLWTKWSWWSLVASPSFNGHGGLMAGGIRWWGQPWSVAPLLQVAAEMDAVVLDSIRASCSETTLAPSFPLCCLCKVVVRLISSMAMLGCSVQRSDVDGDGMRACGVSDRAISPVTELARRVPRCQLCNRTWLVGY